MGRSISWRFHRYTAYGARGAYGDGRTEGNGEDTPKRPSKEEIEKIIARYVKKPEQQRR